MCLEVKPNVSGFVLQVVTRASCIIITGWREFHANEHFVTKWRRRKDERGDNTSFNVRENRLTYVFACDYSETSIKHKSIVA